MSKTVKWIVGIVVVVLILAALVAIPFAMRGYMLANGTSAALPNYGQGRNGGPMMGGNNGWQHPQVPGYNDRNGGRMGGRQEFNRGFGGRSPRFGFGFMFLSGILRLIPLALFGLLLYGVYQLGKRSGKHVAPVVVPAQAVAPVANEPAAAVTPDEPVI